MKAYNVGYVQGGETKQIWAHTAKEAKAIFAKQQGIIFSSYIVTRKRPIY